MYQAIDAVIHPADISIHLNGNPLTIMAKIYGDSKWIRIITEDGDAQQQVDIFVPNLKVANQLGDVIHEINQSLRGNAVEATDIDDANKDEIVEIDV